MYLRPRSIFERFLVAEKLSRLDERGRQAVEFRPSGDEIFCTVSTATPNEREKLKQLHHETTHVLAQRYGQFKAKVGDMLIGGTRRFLITALENPGGVEFWRLYYCVERFDL